jgi:hypothetical protein
MRPQSESNWRLMPVNYAVFMRDVNICMFLFNAKAQRRRERKEISGPLMNANKR